MCSSPWLPCRSLDLPFAPCLVVYHFEPERFTAKARERSGSRQSIWQRVNPVNVVLVRPTCEGFGCSVGNFGTDMAGVVFAVSEDCDLMYDSGEWGIAQGAYAQYLGDLQSGDAQTFSFADMRSVLLKHLTTLRNTNRPLGDFAVERNIIASRVLCDGSLPQIVMPLCITQVKLSVLSASITWFLAPHASYREAYLRQYVKDVDSLLLASLPHSGVSKIAHPLLKSTSPSEQAIASELPR